MFKTLIVIGVLAAGGFMGAKALHQHHHLPHNVGPTVVTVKVPNPLPASGGQQSGGGNIYVP
jgi:hypothetical protein